MRRRIPQVSTRACYDLSTGERLRNVRYFLSPRSYFEEYTAHEIAIMVHGMRNDRAGAAQKFAIARNTLRKLGYSHPLVGYTYDADVRGAHAAKTHARALRVANSIATKNGAHLAMFISDMRRKNPRMRFRLLGHSLGSIVIASTVRHLARKHIPLRSVHLFGASLQERDLLLPSLRGSIRHVLEGPLVNHYCPTDEVLGEAETARPIGLHGMASRRPAHYIQRRVHPRNHRFASYAAVLRSFP